MRLGPNGSTQLQSNRPGQAFMASDTAATMWTYSGRRLANAKLVGPRDNGRLILHRRPTCEDIRFPRPHFCTLHFGAFRWNF
jgi:hypothetical protein